MKNNMNKPLTMRLLIVLMIALTLLSCKRRGAGGSNSIPELQTNTPQRNETVESNPQVLNSAMALQETLRKVAESITPAVVNIRAERVQNVQPEFREFFRFFRRQMPQQRRGQAIGSGFIINADGYIITNAHVVKNAAKITIVLQNEQEYNARLIGSDDATDIALLKINASSGNMPKAPLGNSDDIRVGDIAIAIGNPFGLRGTVTMGIISAKGRSDISSDENATLKNFIQTDVSINRGNSGGPLLNIKGQVIGVNSMIYSPSGGNIGIGFAIPINIVKKVVKQLMQTGRVERGFIGALIQPMNEATARYFGLDRNSGVIVASVQRGGPADRAGLRGGDVILEVNGQKVTDFGTLKRLVTDVTPGSKVKIKIKRKDKVIDVELVVGRLAAAQGADNQRYYEGGGQPDRQDSVPTSGTNWLGMHLSPSGNGGGSRELEPEGEGNREGGNWFNRQNGTGVVIQRVDSDSPAEKAGIKAGDVILSVDYKDIKSLAEMKRFIDANKTKNSFFLKIRRGNGIVFLAVEKNR